MSHIHHTLRATRDQLRALMVTILDLPPDILQEWERTARQTWGGSPGAVMPAGTAALGPLVDALRWVDALMQTAQHAGIDASAVTVGIAGNPAAQSPEFGMADQ